MAAARRRQLLRNQCQGDVLQPPPEENLVKLEDAGADDAQGDQNQHLEDLTSFDSMEKMGRNGQIIQNIKK